MARTFGPCMVIKSRFPMWVTLSPVLGWHRAFFCRCTTEMSSCTPTCNVVSSFGTCHGVVDENARAQVRLESV